MRWGTLLRHRHGYRALQLLLWHVYLPWKGRTTEKPQKVQEEPETADSLKEGVYGQETKRWLSGKIHPLLMPLLCASIHHLIRPVMHSSPWHEMLPFLTSCDHPFIVAMMDSGFSWDVYNGRQSLMIKTAQSSQLDLLTPSVAEVLIVIIQKFYLHKCIMSTKGTCGTHMEKSTMQSNKHNICHTHATTLDHMASIQDNWPSRESFAEGLIRSLTN